MYSLPFATKLRQGNIFTSVCQEFCPRGGGWSASVHAGIHHPLGRHPPQQTTTAADGTHPTGMHSCYCLFVVQMVTMTTNLGLSRWRRVVVLRLRAECVSHPPTQSRVPSHSVHPSLPARLITKHSL